jgi:hypothetical protein
MILDLRPACLALALAAVAGPACAQTWVYEPDTATAYRPRVVVQERYVPRAYYRAYAYEPVVATRAYRAYAYEPVVATRAYRAYAYEPVVAAPAIAPVRRTVVNRTIVRERIVTETTTTRAAVVSRPAVAAYAYAPGVTDAYALAPAPARIVTRPVAVTEAYAYAPIRTRVVTPVPIVRTYLVDPLAVDPVTGAFLSDQ